MNALTAVASIFIASASPAPECWAATGNWNNASNTSCAFNSRQPLAPRHPRHRCEPHDNPKS